MICSYCGHEIDRSDDVCPLCGTRVDSGSNRGDDFNRSSDEEYYDKKYCHADRQCNQNRYAVIFHNHSVQHQHLYKIDTFILLCNNIYQRVQNAL